MLVEGGILRSVIHRVVTPPGEQVIYHLLSFIYVLKPGIKVSVEKLMGKEKGEGGWGW